MYLNIFIALAIIIVAGLSIYKYNKPGKSAVGRAAELYSVNMYVNRNADLPGLSIYKYNKPDKSAVIKIYL